MKPDKLKIIQDCLENEKKQLESAIKKIVVARNESPLPTESRSDTSRIQADNMINKLNEKLKNLEKLTDEMPKTIPENKKTVGLWSYLEIKNSNYKMKFILVPEGYGGREYNGVKLVSISAPLAETVLNKKLNQSIDFNENKLRIYFLL